jgi:hypothetical protein
MAGELVLPCTKDIVSIMIWNDYIPYLNYNHYFCKMTQLGKEFKIWHMFYHK